MLLFRCFFHRKTLLCNSIMFWSILWRIITNFFQATFLLLLLLLLSTGSSFGFSSFSLCECDCEDVCVRFCACVPYCCFYHLLSFFSSFTLEKPLSLSIHSSLSLKMKSKIYMRYVFRIICAKMRFIHTLILVCGYITFMDSKFYLIEGRIFV